MSFFHINQTRQIDGCLTPTNEFARKPITLSPLKDDLPLAKVTPSTTTNVGTITDTSSTNNNNSANSVSTLTESQIIGAKRSNSTDLATTTIPSPPQSPYARALTFDESDTRFAELIFPRPTSASRFDVNVIYPASEDEHKEEEEEHKVETSATIPSTTKEKKRSFPLEDLRDSSLYINAYGDLKIPGFKKRQLKFLSQYQLVNVKPTYTKKSVSNNLQSSNNNFAMNTRYETTTSRNRDYGSSDTDNDRPRTRRIVKESSVTLETDESSISRPSTPRKRKPTVRRLESPNGSSSSSSSAQPYNFDYKSVPDYSPPLSTLPNNARCMKTEWKGQAMDLSDDPLIGELHPAEIQLASILRLPANIYLDSKRRLFVEKVKRMRSGLPFRRTDAQKACKIDVNKASRLYASFEKVGWLSDSNFTQYMKK
ncbi:hypothetical protein CANARDRAFT_28387 [[Candida] arabinofermentans NRRL YB-2248]|uniref:SWIRM domain-containing protein n=1 Tax=[Candida] arabinofermentans NRRL YB-2248 TaxID=983967 RepID=A0A1E4T1K2_9ASCO|nr:hypothetical protein CANARDRAFT_28387 [[Candida] arabinofermentans NRRL YB-2248]